MPNITLNFTDAQVEALRGAVEAEAEKLAHNPDVYSKLGSSEPIDVWSLPLARKAKLVLYSHLMFLRQRHERDAAAFSAGNLAAAEAHSSSPIEVE